MSHLWCCFTCRAYGAMYVCMGFIFLLPTCLAYGATNMSRLWSYQHVTPSAFDSSLTNLLPFHSGETKRNFDSAVDLFFCSVRLFICSSVHLFSTVGATLC